MHFQLEEQDIVRSYSSAVKDRFALPSKPFIQEMKDAGVDWHLHPLYKLSCVIDIPDVTHAAVFRLTRPHAVLMRFLQ